MNKQYKQKPKQLPTGQNFANYYVGAVILEQSRDLLKLDKVLLDSAEEYMITECSKKDLYFVICLKEEISLESMALINKELYSSTVKNFYVYGSVVYPATDWELLGKFESDDLNDWQIFYFEHNFLRYLKIQILDFHQAEYHCTLTQIRVFGKTVIGDLVDSYKREKVPKPQKNQTLKEEIKISFHEDHQNQTCSHLDFFYYKVDNNDPHYIDVLPYESKQSLFKITAQNTLILSHNFELFKQEIETIKQHENKQRQEQEQIQQTQKQLIQEIQELRQINTKLETDIQNINSKLFLVVLLSSGGMFILVFLLIPNRKQTEVCCNRNKYGKGTLVTSSDLLTPQIQLTQKHKANKNGKFIKQN